MRLLIDMNLSPRWTDALAGFGIEATHWSEIGARSAAARHRLSLLPLA
jgi:predicted nuclease of predicted toxin-antitoxin system